MEVALAIVPFAAGIGLLVGLKSWSIILLLVTTGRGVWLTGLNSSFGLLYVCFIQRTHYKKCLLYSTFIDNSIQKLRLCLFLLYCVVVYSIGVNFRIALLTNSTRLAWLISHYLVSRY